MSKLDAAFASVDSEKLWILGDFRTALKGKNNSQ